MLDSARLLFDLQHVSQVVQTISGCFDTTKIAQSITDALVNQFDCVFARLWVVEVDQPFLRLIASSGLHTHTDGSFSRVPMGAYKVGKIAQNQIPFLSNHLADEPWVKDRDWAIANHIQGFAGYPLITHNRVVGVLAAFSTRPMPPEFLEVLQVLCMITTIALDAATQLEQAHQQVSLSASVVANPPLSDQIASLLKSTRVTLVGTEHPLSVTLNHAFLCAAEQLSTFRCRYCRLSYGDEAVALEAILALDPAAEENVEAGIQSKFVNLRTLTTWLSGELELQWVSDRCAIQFLLKLPNTAVSQDAVGTPQKLSEREVEVMNLLAQGLRDREIAQKLYISESTVKFHINNCLTKLKAKNRYQGVYKAAIQGFV